MWIVRLALRRPYTFVVVAPLLLIMAPIVLTCPPVWAKSPQRSVTKIGPFSVLRVFSHHGSGSAGWDPSDASHSGRFESEWQGTASQRGMLLLPFLYHVLGVEDLCRSHL